MIDKIAVTLTYTALAFLGLATLPYLLWRVWDSTIPFNRKERHPDFNPGASSSVGQ